MESQGGVDPALLSSAITIDSLAVYLYQIYRTREQPTEVHLREVVAELQQARYKTISEIDCDLRRGFKAAEHFYQKWTMGIPAAIGILRTTLCIVNKTYMKQMEPDAEVHQMYGDSRHLVQKEPVSHAEYINAYIIKRGEPDVAMLARHINKESLAQYLERTDGGLVQPDEERLLEWLNDLKGAGYRTLGQVHRDRLRGRRAAEAMIAQVLGGEPGRAGGMLSLTLSIVNKTYREAREPGSSVFYGVYEHMVDR